MQNFVSAAVGIAVLAALIRGIVSRSGNSIGNFWHDMVRIILYVLLPISIVGALFLVSQGVIQNLSHATVIHTLSGGTQVLAQGPVASQEAIKELGTNGGGFFNVNSSFPFENPSGLTNFTEMLLILVIPAALTYTYGRMVGSQRQGWAIFSAMFALFIVGVIVVYIAEQHGTPAQHAAGLHTAAIHGSTGGNLEGKEQRFGIADTSLWTAITTVTSCGAVNGAFESLTGIGGAVPFHGLDTFRADVSYSFAATITPSIQYFQTNGTSDAAYWGTPNGSPNSSGMIAEIAYVPWGKPNSFITWGNVRLAVQYVSYFRFDGVTNNAAANNALYFSVWAAAHF